VIGGEYRCRVCGLAQRDAIWGPDGACPTYDICDCCGCEFGYEDCLAEAVRNHRERWLAAGANWFEPSAKHPGWDLAEQLESVPRFYLRILPGLPGDGPVPVQFSATGRGTHAEGQVVEFTLASSEKWIGNFQAGVGGVSTALADPHDRDHAIVVSGGQGYVVASARRELVRCFGGMITDLLLLPDQRALLVGNGLWFERIEGGETRWRSRRVSWDGMANVRVEGDRLKGDAYDPMDDRWAPFELDLDTGEVLGGSYPPEL